MLYLTESPIFQAHAKEMADAIAANRIPAIAGGTLLGIAGVAIVSVGTNAAEVGAQVARYADRIIRGAKPGDLPVEQITKVDLILNAKAARAVGLTIPPSLLMRADRVVE